MPQVHLRHAAAHRRRWTRSSIATASSTLVILNSVAQYFPSADYLLSVIDTGVAALRDGGSFYLGDIRNLVLLETFHTSVQLFQAPGDLPVAALRERVQRAIGQKEQGRCSIPSSSRRCRGGIRSLRRWRSTSRTRAATAS